LENPDLGLGLPAGHRHYRAFVGPPEKYDLVAANQFNLLTFMGLRENHYLLDIGCGSLRAGRLIIPYLLSNRYYGIEPEEWLVEEGINKEIGQDQVKIKKPKFIFDTNFQINKFGVEFDFAIAQSIFSHACQGQIHQCLEEISRALKPQGIFLATFIEGKDDYQGSRWIYPECVTYTRKTLGEIAGKYQLATQVIDWPHPNNQTWVMFCHRDYQNNLFDPTYKYTVNRNK
jgi:SAM-dependent methyltransferase